MFMVIGNTPRDYAWGSTAAIAGFRGLEATGSPEAELWLGAHPGSPAHLLDPASVGHADLAAWIEADPEQSLGTRLAEAARLPFLMKVLAAAAPLSLQAHPTPAQARAGYAREEADGVPLTAYDRNYKDEFHKPELIVAVSDTFDALSGFRPLDEVRGVLEVLRAADAEAPEPDPGALDLLESHLSGEHALRDTVEWLLRDGRGGDTGEASWVIDRVTALAASETALASRYVLSFETVGALADAYPGDAGVVISLLLNRVRLVRGEALYLAAGNIHAYLDGLGIELMAASDNVLRGGLTPKHIDVAELLDVLDFTPIAPPYLAPVEVSPGVTSYRPGVPDFELYRVEPAAGAVGRSRVSLEGPAIVVVEGADVVISGGTGASVALGRGESVYVTPDEAALEISGPGIAWIATTGTTVQPSV
ncbi:mannose-6-phosphate isomerase, class I [Agromyces cerinus]|uniref:mannose-6-phosphate isomerase n=1 Tax=Agromyces cerinus subsp. cerinus TaxID=232089 RepID=A0A1N6DIN7_9MICO|nr:mannose-6-phosphate isomerase, class I [Agromyces cerinus]SIN70618.1 mannose-6-phosphate isomerase, type 1 [Agromyces cerinus subsp. cerinus]